MKKILIFTAAVLLLAGCTQGRPHTIGIVAHRGYWQCEAGGFAPNSLASLQSAQDAGFYGSELDIHLTTDGEIVVFHDDAVEGVRINANPSSAFAGFRLGNGERLPLLGDCLDRLAASDATRLVIEFKSHPDAAQEDALVDRTLGALKARGLYDPERVMFISFSLHACTRVAGSAPGFAVQYLLNDMSPADVHALGINGIDYHYRSFYEHPDWVQEAHDLGMTVNCWTVNRQEDMEDMIALGVDFITTDQPALLRELLGDREKKSK